MCKVSDSGIPLQKFVPRKHYARLQNFATWMFNAALFIAAKEWKNKMLKMGLIKQIMVHLSCMQLLRMVL